MKDSNQDAIKSTIELVKQMSYVLQQPIINRKVLLIYAEEIKRLIEKM